MRSDHLSDDAWELEADNVLALRKKLSQNGRTLKNWISCVICRGVVTGLNEVFVINGKTRADLIAADPQAVS